jgi:hypothetical protein
LLKKTRPNGLVELRHLVATISFGLNGPETRDNFILDGFEAAARAPIGRKAARSGKSSAAPMDHSWQREFRWAAAPDLPQIRHRIRDSQA